MPVNPEYHETAWYVDPEDLQLYEIVAGSITGNQITMADLTGGQLTASGGAIREVGTGRIVQPLQVEYPAQLDVMDSGQIIFSRETSQEVTASPTASASRRGATGTVDMFLPSGQQVSVEVRHG